MKEMSAGWTDLGRRVWADNALLCAGLRDEPVPVIMMQPATHRYGDELAIGWPRCGQFGIRVGNPMDALMDSSFVEPTDVLVDDGTELPFVPDEHPVKQLSTQGADEALDVSRGVGSMVWRSDPPDAASLSEPHVEGGAAAVRLAIDLDCDRLAELAEDAVVVVDEKLRLALEGGVPELLLDPGQGRVLGDVDMHNLAAAEFHDDEDVQGGEADGVLDAEVAGPDGIGLVLEERTPRHGVAPRPRGLDHVLADGGRRMVDAEFDLQLEGDAVLPVLGVACPSKHRPQGGAK